MTSKYKFDEIVTNKKSYIKRYVDYASSRTDAPHEFHEAFALSQLGIASHGLLYIWDNEYGQALNTYFLMHGRSAIMRKSTCMRIATHILEEGLNHGYGQSDDFTPEGLMEAMQRNDGRPMVVYLDEFTSLLDRLIKQSMTGLKPIILKFLNSRSHVYTRTSKGPVKKKVQDEVRITNGHLSIAGNITPSITQRITEIDVDDGFLGRFLIVSPQRKPEPRLSEPPTKAQQIAKQALMVQLSEIYQGCQNCREYAVQNPGLPTILIEPSGRSGLWEFQKEIEALEKKVNPVQFILCQRLPEYSVKLSCLVALAEFDTRALSNGPLIVGPDNVDLGVKLARRYMDYAIDFGKNVGLDKMDNKAKKVVDYIKGQPDQMLPKRVVCRNLNISKFDADQIEATLLLQDRIKAVPIKKEGSKRATIHWSLSNGQPPVEPVEPKRKSPATHRQRMEDTTQTDDAAEEKD